mgnify:CR=1 FL=1
MQEEQETNSLEDVLKQYYYSNKHGFQSVQRFYHTLRDAGVKVTQKQVKAFLDRQGAYQEAAQPRKPALFNTVWADSNGENYQKDTMFMTNYPYAGFKYILLVVDVHSRYLGALPLKDKKITSYIKAFSDIVEQQMDGIWPQRLNCDNEYNKTQFLALLEKHQVEPVFSQPGQPYKNAIVERLIRTLRSLFSRWRLGDPNGGADWPDALPDLIYNYNNTLHSTIKTLPIKVWQGKEVNRQNIIWIPNKLKIGDKVRYLIRDRASPLNNKIDTLKWSKHIYTISESQGARWLLSEYSIDGRENPYPNNAFMEYELKPIHPEEQRTAPESRVLINTQREIAATERRMKTDDIGPISQDDGARPGYYQLSLQQPRTRKQTNFYIRQNEKGKEKETEEEQRNSNGKRKR